MNVLITFDYELFLGDITGSVDECLIKPTEELIKIAQRNNVIFNFFIDSCYLLRILNLKNKFPELESDYNKIINQLSTLIQLGHTIELHIHPQWYKSEYLGNGEWSFDYSFYKITDFNDIEISKIISENVFFIKENFGINPNAYRAGGWSYEPFKKISEVLLNNDIKIDSTVLPNASYSSYFQRYNFINCPRKTFWRFENNPIVEDKNGRFIEIPISKYHNNFLRKIIMIFLMKIKKRSETDIFGNGKTITSSQNTQNKRIEKLKKLFTTDISYVSLDGISSIFISSIYKKYLKIYGENSFFVILGHPKSLSNFSLKRLEKFIFNDREANFISYDYISKLLR